MASNHSSNFEALIYYAYLEPRLRTALGKTELWGNPFTRFLMQIWSIIPVAPIGQRLSARSAI